MPITEQNMFKTKVLKKIRSLRREVVVRDDLKDLGSSRQISRALRSLTESGEIAKIGRGIYAKTKMNKYLNKPVIRVGFEAASLEALKRLNVQWEYGENIKKYNTGFSQQVPGRLEIRLKSRFRRTLSYRNNTLNFEGNINAR